MKTQIYFITILLLVLIIMVFALQNANPVSLKIIGWEINSMLSLVIIASIIIGALMSMLSGLPSRTRKNKIIRDLEEKVEKLNEKLNTIQEVEIKKGDIQKGKKAHEMTFKEIDEKKDQK